jgi:hypothetical protein
MKKALILFTLILFYGESSAQNGWFSKATFPGTPRVGASGFLIGNDIYIGAGFSIDTIQPVSFNDFWKYNIITDVWTAIDSLPIHYGIGYPNAFAINGKGYLFGGTVDSMMSQFTNHHVWEYDTATNNWLQKNDVPFVPEFNNPSFAIDSFGFVNLPNQFYNSVYKYSPLIDQWTLMPDTFASNTLWGIYGQSTISDSSHGYIFGGTGISVSNCQWFDRIFQYNFNTNSWGFISPELTFDTCYSNGFMFLIDSAFYIGNGSSSPNGYWGGNPYYDRVYKYDMRDSTFVQLPPFPFGPSTASNYFTINNCAYLICGAGGMNGNRTLIFCPNSINSVNEINKSESILISPNPFFNSLQIKSRQTISKIIIYNSMLQSVFQLDPKEVLDLNLEVGNLEKGVYFIQVMSQSSAQSTVKKLIKL